MRKRRIFIISGVWIAVLPYLGFPLILKNVLMTLSGIVVVALAYFLFKEEKANQTETYDNFSENRQGSSSSVI